MQGSPSSQGPVLFVYTHPLMGLQESVVQTLRSAQLKEPLPTHAPPEHVELVVHAFPSLQGSVLSMWMHPPMPHESVVHELPSLQPAATHEPAQHICAPVQALVRIQTSSSHTAV